MLAQLVLASVLAFSSVAESPRCDAVDPSRFWLPPEVERLRPQFEAKAKSLNDSGMCVVDGWYGKTDGRFYFTVVPPGADLIGRVVSFSVEELGPQR